MKNDLECSSDGESATPRSPGPEPKFDRRKVLSGLVGGAAAVSTAGWPWSLAADSPGTAGKRLPIVDRREPCRGAANSIAAGDYCTSLARYGGRLSNSIRQLWLTAQHSDEVQFGVVVIGSGYGASICAARLSKAIRPGQRLAILERGREWLPGSFPDTFSAAWKSTRQEITGPQRGQVINPLGLFQISFNDEVNILAGSGLGGTSLINANVALRPHSDTFARPEWPAALRQIENLTPYYNLAARQLSLIRPPLDMTAKMRVRRRTAQALSHNENLFDRSPMAVMYDTRFLDESGQNPQGMIQRLCTQCGDCITGCNVGAKNTLVYNYLPVAKANGAEIYTQVQVDRIEREGSHYRIHLTYIDDTSGEITRHPLSITSEIVVLGAGSPGSAEILLQSQSDEFQFAPALGKRWSANGDMLGFVVKICEAVGIAGTGTCDSTAEPVGTTLQTTLNYYDRPGLENKFIIQDAAIPRAMVNLFGMMLRDRELAHSMVMLAVGHDEARGELVWKDGRYQVQWPGLKESRFREMIFKEFETIAAAEGGQYKRLGLFGDNMVTVHPLGGCAMSDDPLCGVCNDRGQVYDANCSTCREPNLGPPVHPGLFVADASILPTALGANPYLTICALAERIAEQLVRNPDHAHLFPPDLARN